MHMKMITHTRTHRTEREREWENIKQQSKHVQVLKHLFQIFAHVGFVSRPVKVNNEPVEVVSNFKYLGTLIDNKLSFSDNSDLIYKKSQQCLYLLQKLRSFDVSRELLQIVYKSLVESVLTFNIVVWYGNLGVKGKAKLARIVGMAGKIVGAKQDSLSDLYLTAVERKTARILDDAKHPLFSQFQKLRSGRRYKVPIARKNVYKKSFIPSAISVLNSRAT